jgi:CheY-specific phosphatase CheX
MTIKKFTYKGLPREVIVTEDLSDSIKGYDISKFDKEEAKKVWREMAGGIDMEKLTEAEKSVEYAKFTELKSNFRHFKKALMA